MEFSIPSPPPYPTNTSSSCFLHRLLEPPLCGAGTLSFWTVVTTRISCLCRSLCASMCRLRPGGCIHCCREWGVIAAVSGGGRWVAKLSFFVPAIRCRPRRRCLLSECFQLL